MLQYTITERKIEYGQTVDKIITYKSKIEAGRIFRDNGVPLAKLLEICKVAENNGSHTYGITPYIHLKIEKVPELNTGDKGMNFQEMLVKLSEGYRVRAKHWVREECLYQDEDGRICLTSYMDVRGVPIDNLFHDCYKNNKYEFAGPMLSELRPGDKFEFTDNIHTIYTMLNSNIMVREKYVYCTDRELCGTDEDVIVIRMST